MSSSTPDGGEPTKKGLFGRRATKAKDPKKPGRMAQVRQVFTMTRKADPAAVWWMILAALAVLVVAVLVGIWIDQVVYTLIIGLPLAILAATVVLGRRAEKAAFAQIEGQPGATSAVMGQLKRGWFYDQEPVAAEAGGQMRGMRDLHNAAMVFRAVGKPGVVLIAEGPRGAAQRLAAAERKRVSRVVGDEVPVHTITVGSGESDTTLRKVVPTIKKLPKKLSNDEALVVQQRLKALGGKNRPPIPAGIDPSRAPRMSRKALRGR
ncbi:DUF4191 domain-containing protein [Ornithinimicrobium pekingense]|uniref:Membrane protein n=1 Tax=Ornithinimicrobium pekingense TaxID=384677 RepID=A0ABQ2FA92_9MICO|nr:DUF4191 domain-containing protein [Ornithinimicrobium pekingense]GGK68999.1 membrane protein [Ornithinimicrobium pekingense]